MEQAAQIRFVRGLDLLGCGARAESCDGLANPCGDDQQHSGDGEGTKHEERKPIHTLMILHGRAYGMVLRPRREEVEFSSAKWCWCKALLVAFIEQKD